MQAGRDSGEVELDKGVIVASRHIHMSDKEAEQFGVKDKDIVSVKVDGARGLVFNNVLIRESEICFRYAH